MAAAAEAPGPWRQFEAKTTFLPVAGIDWLLVKQGRKTEVREVVPTAIPVGTVTPLPVVGYTERKVQGFESIPLILEDTWTEPVAAISDESLGREGFPDMAHFRRYWMGRTGSRFRPLQRIQVFRFRVLRPDEYPTAGLQLLDRLYGEHLHG